MQPILKAQLNELNAILIHPGHPDGWWMDGWMDGWMKRNDGTNESTNERTNEGTDGRTYERANEWVQHRKKQLGLSEKKTHNTLIVS